MTPNSQHASPSAFKWFPLVHQRLAEQSLRRTPVSQFMSRVTSIPATTPVQQAAWLIQNGDDHCIVVVDDTKPVGIVTTRGMIKILADFLVAHPADSRCIRDYMSAPVLTLSADASLHDAAALIESKRVGQIPIVNGANDVVGLITRQAIAKAKLAAVEQERDAIEKEVYSRGRELSKANRELRALALQDSLLKVGNRRAMEMDVQSTHLNAIRYAQSYAVALIDVDFFKRYNDCYGHRAGDNALVTVARCTLDSIRRGDRVYRYGGEELLILMPETALREAMEAVCRLTQNLFDLNLEHRQSPHRRLTISAGVSAFSPRLPGATTQGHANHRHSKDGWEAIVDEADAFLYQAKSLGRNQVYGLAEAVP